MTSMTDEATPPDALEKNQVWLYLTAALAGLVLGALQPRISPVAQYITWPALAVLMYATFAQVPLGAIPRALKDGRFLAASVVGNFVVIPPIVWLLVQWAPDVPAVRIGILLTLIAPCTDWFITFTHLGRGDPARASALAPLNMLVQIVLLPMCLNLFMGPTEGHALGAGLAPAVAVVIGPLVLAACTELWARRAVRSRAATTRPSSLRRWTEALSRVPVPALALVICLVTASHASDVVGSLGLLPRVGWIYVVYLVVALLLAKGLATVFALPRRPSRTLAFTFGTRNSFVVLPLVLSLPEGWGLAAVVVIMQSVVELLGMILFLRIVPSVLFPDQRSSD